MMKKMIAAVLALMMVFSLALASEEAAQPFTIYPPKAAQTVFEFEGNPTTGYRWTAFLVKEGVVELNSVEGEYTEFEHEEEMVGVGGMYRFELTAVAPGETIVLFHYGRGWEEEDMITKPYLVMVLEDGTMEIMDLEGYAPMIGSVVTVNEDGSVLLNTETHGEVIARFPEEMPLPTEGENVKIWFNGVMTMSLPGQINVIGWESIAPVNARMGR